MSAPVRLADAITHSRELELSLPATARQYQVYFLRNYTIEGVEPFLRHALLQLGMRPQVLFGGYGTYRQDLEEGANEGKLGRVDALVVCWVIEELDPNFGGPDWTPEQARREMVGLIESLERGPARTILIQTFVPPFVAEIGTGRNSMDFGVRALNQCIRDEVAKRSPRFSLLDCAQFARQLGEDATLDARFWYLAKAPYKPALMHRMAIEISRLARVQCGLAKKLLVLDCDNTLWGGVVGEDGLTGLLLDPHDYPGKAFYDFQKAILRLSRRGVVLALCSKNNEADVFDVLDHHPACLVRRTDIAAYRINWENKAIGICEIAQQLNLGIDSVVFVDDSPHEIELIRRALPQVTCLQTPMQHWLLPTFLERAGVFDANVVTDEDVTRTQRYLDDHHRERSRASATNLHEYLASLQIVAVITRATPAAIPRVVQLFQKTNQFNLTTRRLVALEIERMTASDSHALFTMSVSDRFGDLGLVGVLTAARQGREVSVTDLLLSCRALSRGLEFALVTEAIHRLSREWSATAWRAIYEPTLKNTQARNFWDRVGFKLECEVNGARKYFLSGAPETAQTISHITVTDGKQ